MRGCQRLDEVPKWMPLSLSGTYLAANIDGTGADVNVETVGGDLVLKRMRRRHLRQDVIALASRLRALRPEIVLGADLIAGFPTEDEAAFGDTVRLIEEADLTYLHVFPYSPRPGTPAARMPQVPPALRRERRLSFVMVSHDLAVVTHLCERLVVMQRGRIVETLASADLAAQRVQQDYTRTLMEASAGFTRPPGR